MMKRIYQSVKHNNIFINPQKFVYQFSSEQSTLHEESQEQTNQKNQILKGVEEYEKALKFFQRGKFRISQEFFKRALLKLEKEHLQETPSYIMVLKKLVLNQNQLKLYEDSQNTLEEIIEINQKINSNNALIYKDYNNLLLHCLRTNLNKAIILGKALISEHEIKNIPIAYQKIFHFNLGTAYLLKGNYVDAKQRLRECLVQEPNNLLKGYSLNNLAVASWWHKHPNFISESDEEEEEGDKNLNLQKGPLKGSEQEQQDQYSAQQIDADFENVIPLLKRSIYNMQSQVLLDPDNLVPIDFLKFDPAVQMLFSNKFSGTPLLNIQEFLFNTNPDKRDEAVFWFKYSLKFYEYVDPINIDRSLITLALFCSNQGQFEKAEKLFQKSLDMLEDNDTYNKVLCLQLYGNLIKKNPDRQKEGENLLAQAYQLADQLPFWANKLIHVSIPELEI